MKGAATGPQLVVAASDPPAGNVFERLLAISTLPWIRGTLVLVRLDIIGHGLDNLDSIMSLGKVDRTIILPWGNNEQPDENLTQQSYRSVLLACSQLGMIKGRSVACLVGGYSK